MITVVNHPQSDAEARSMASEWWHTGGGSAVQYAEHEGVK